MPSSSVSDSANAPFTPSRRKNGRWTKWCEMVFDVHQTPMPKIAAPNTGSVLEVGQRADDRVIGVGADFRHADAGHVAVRFHRRILFGSQPRLHVPAGA